MQQPIVKCYPDMFSSLSLLISTTWLTESKTFEKSINRQHTYLLSSNIIETALVRSISNTASRLKAKLIIQLLHWYNRKIWYLTINRSTILDSIGVTDIGRKSPNSVTGIHFGTGNLTV